MPGQIQVGHRHADADPFHTVPWPGPHSLGLGVVLVGVFREARIHARLIERLGVGFPLVSRVPLDGDGPIAPVEVATEIPISLHFPEVGQDVGESPFVVSHSRPTVIIVGNAPIEYLAVNGAGAAHGFASGNLKGWLIGSYPGGKSPVMGAIGGKIHVVAQFQVVGQVLKVRVIGASFQE